MVQIPVSANCQKLQILATRLFRGSGGQPPALPGTPSAIFASFLDSLTIL